MFVGIPCYCRWLGFLLLADELRLLLIIYVDDVKLSGPEKNIKQGWALLRKGLVIEPEARIEKNGIAYLGCTQRCCSLTLESGRMATGMSYGMEAFLDRCVPQYCELAKITSPLRSYATPMLLDDHARSAAGAPGTGPVTECSWCRHIASPTLFATYPTVAALASKPKVRPVETGDEPQQGELHDVASRVLMKVLWAARLCPRDLLRAVNRLATCVAKWASEHDIM